MFEEGSQDSAPPNLAADDVVELVIVVDHDEAVSRYGPSRTCLDLFRAIKLWPWKRRHPAVDHLSDSAMGDQIRDYPTGDQIRNYAELLGDGES